MSTGGNDKSLFQWKVGKDVEDDCDVAEGEDLSGIADYGAFTVESGAAGEITSETLSFDEEEDADEFLAVKPWLGVCVDHTEIFLSL